MLYLMMTLFGLSSTVEELGSPKYLVREAAEERLSRDGIGNLITAYAGQGSTDCETASRCRQVVNNSWLPAFQRVSVFVYMVYYPGSSEDDSDGTAIPVSLVRWFEKYLEQHSLVLEYIGQPPQDLVLVGRYVVRGVPEYKGYN